jgi:hypothetical protein
MFTFYAFPAFNRNAQNGLRSEHLGKAERKLPDEAIAQMGWTVLPHPAYSPDLAL